MGAGYGCWNCGLCAQMRFAWSFCICIYNKQTPCHVSDSRFIGKLSYFVRILLLHFVSCDRIATKCCLIDRKQSYIQVYTAPVIPPGRVCPSKSCAIRTAAACSAPKAKTCFLPQDMRAARGFITGQGRYTCRQHVCRVM